MDTNIATDSSLDLSESTLKLVFDLSGVTIDKIKGTREVEETITRKAGKSESSHVEDTYTETITNGSFYIEDGSLSYCSDEGKFEITIESGKFEGDDYSSKLVLSLNENGLIESEHGESFSKLRIKLGEHNIELKKGEIITKNTENKVINLKNLTLLLIGGILSGLITYNAVVKNNVAKILNTGISKVSAASILPSFTSRPVDLKSGQKYTITKEDAKKLGDILPQKVWSGFMCDGKKLDSTKVRAGATIAKIGEGRYFLNNGGNLYVYAQVN